MAWNVPSLINTGESLSKNMICSKTEGFSRKKLILYCVGSNSFWWYFINPLLIFYQKLHCSCEWEFQFFFLPVFFSLSFSLSLFFVSLFLSLFIFRAIEVKQKSIWKKNEPGEHSYLYLFLFFVILSLTNKEERKLKGI